MNLYYTVSRNMESINILNVRIDNITQQELLEKLKRGVLVTPNIDHIVLCQKDRGFYYNASMAEYSVCDSRVLQIVSKVVGNPVKETIRGSSFFRAYCDYHSKNENIKIFLLGAQGGVAERAKDRINNRIGRNIIVGAYSPSFGFERDEKECQKIIELLKQSGANVVLVGLGNPKQTNWIYKYKDLLPTIDVFMALGATIDFEAGTLPRAPIALQKMGLEWLYRFLKEPKRLFKRYFVDDIKFFYYFLLRLLGLYKNPFENNFNLDYGNQHYR